MIVSGNGCLALCVSHLIGGWPIRGVPLLFSNVGFIEGCCAKHKCYYYYLLQSESAILFFKWPVLVPLWVAWSLFHLSKEMCCSCLYQIESENVIHSTVINTINEFKVIKPAIFVEKNYLKSLISSHNINSGCYDAPDRTFIPNCCLYTVCLTLIWMNSSVCLEVIWILSGCDKECY